MDRDVKLAAMIGIGTIIAVGAMAYSIDDGKIHWPGVHKTQCEAHAGCTWKANSGIDGSVCVCPPDVDPDDPAPERAKLDACATRSDGGTGGRP